MTLFKKMVINLEFVDLSREIMCTYNNINYLGCDCNVYCLIGTIGATF
jgi:hypothetical protein